MIDRDVSSCQDGVSLAVNRSTKCKSTLPPQSALVLKVLVSMEFGHHPTLVHSSQIAEARRLAS